MDNFCIKCAILGKTGLTLERVRHCLTNDFFVFIENADSLLLIIILVIVVIVVFFIIFAAGYVYKYVIRWFPTGSYLLKVNNRNTEQGVKYVKVNNKDTKTTQNIGVVLVSSLFTLNIFHALL